MQMVVLKLDTHDDDNCKRKVMKIVSTTHGIDSIAMNTKEQKLTITGTMDPITILKKLRKTFRTDVLSIGPVKEPEKKKEEPNNQAQFADYFKPFDVYGYNYYPTYPTYSNYYS